MGDLVGNFVGAVEGELVGAAVVATIVSPFTIPSSSSVLVAQFSPALCRFRVEQRTGPLRLPAHRAYKSRQV